MKKMKIEDLSKSEKFLELRPINTYIVNRYQQAMRQGDEFPPLIVDEQSKVIVSGNHRHEAMLREFGDEHKTEVILESYKSEKEMIIKFTDENTKHGMPLSGISRKKITAELLNKNVSRKKIAELMGVSPKRIESWAGKMVTIIGGNGKKSKGKPKERPAKNGIDTDTMTDEQYQSHIKNDLGIRPEKLINQLIRWFSNEWIADDEYIIEKSEKLYDLLGNFLKEK